MEKTTDKNSYTILFAIVMVVVVGTILAYAATGLYAMGVNENEGSNMSFVSKNRVEQEFVKYITKQLIIQGDSVTEDNNAYLLDLKKEHALAKDPSHQKRLPLLIGEKDGQTFYIAPIRGKGLWDAIWGYVAMDKEMVVLGVYFDHKGETPGLGANINQRFFMDEFTGEHLFDKSNNFNGITVSKGNADPKNLDKTDNEVDAIAGATITGNGVTDMIKTDLKLYVPYFKTLKTN